MKKAFIIVTSVVLVFCFGISVMAKMPPTAEPVWQNTGLVSGSMVFNGDDKTHGVAEIQLVGKPGVTKIESSVVVYKLVDSDWVYVTENSKTVEHRNCALAVEFTGEHGYEYKAEFHFVVYKGTVGEMIDRTMTKVCE